MSVDNRALYLDLLKKSLTCTQYEGLDGSVWLPNKRLHRWALKLVVPGKVRLSKPVPEQERLEGRDWPLLAHTMAGMKRLDHLQCCVETILAEGVPGDFIETGVWRGGSSIFMRAVLKTHDVADRTVWVADSFQGLPAPDAGKYPADAGDEHYTKSQLAISLETVKGNFARYGLLDDQVRFLKGWFKDTLPAAPLGKLALARLDGDLYESTMDALNALYPKLEPGGFLVIDDYGALANCRQAVHDYRERHGIVEPIERIDWTGAFWRRSRTPGKP